MDRLPYALDRDEGERLEFGDAVILLRTTAERSGGAATIWEELPPLLDSRCTSTPARTSCSTSSMAHRAGELGPAAYARASAQFGITWLS